MRIFGKPKRLFCGILWGNMPREFPSLASVLGQGSSPERLPQPMGKKERKKKKQTSKKTLAEVARDLRLTDEQGWETSEEPLEKELESGARPSQRGEALVEEEIPESVELTRALDLVPEEHPEDLEAVLDPEQEEHPEDLEAVMEAVAPPLPLERRAVMLDDADVVEEEEAPALRHPIDTVEGLTAYLQEVDAHAPEVQGRLAAARDALKGSTNRLQKLRGEEARVRALMAREGADQEGLRVELNAVLADVAQARALQRMQQEVMMDLREQASYLSEVRERLRQERWRLLHPPEPPQSPSQKKAAAAQFHRRRPAPVPPRTKRASRVVGPEPIFPLSDADVEDAPESVLPWEDVDLPFDDDVSSPESYRIHEDYEEPPDSYWPKEEDGEISGVYTRERGASEIAPIDVDALNARLAHIRGVMASLPQEDPAYADDLDALESQEEQVEALLAREELRRKLPAVHKAADLAERDFARARAAEEQAEQALVREQRRVEDAGARLEERQRRQEALKGVVMTTTDDATRARANADLESLEREMPRLEQRLEEDRQRLEVQKRALQPFVRAREEAGTAYRDAQREQVDIEDRIHGLDSLLGGVALAALLAGEREERPEVQAAIEADQERGRQERAAAEEARQQTEREARLGAAAEEAYKKSWPGRIGRGARWGGKAAGVTAGMGLLGGLWAVSAGIQFVMDLIVHPGRTLKNVKDWFKKRLEQLMGGIDGRPPQPQGG